MGDDLGEDFGGAIRDRPNDTEQHPAGDTAPGARADPRVAFEALVAFALTLTQWPGGQARALGLAPPARPGQGKTPDDGFIFIKHNDLTPPGLILQGGKCERTRTVKKLMRLHTCSISAVPRAVHDTAVGLHALHLG